MAGKYKNDNKWSDIASWGSDLGLSTWNDEIVCMSTIHPKLFMGSRLSAQSVIDKKDLIDQNNHRYKGNKFNLVCVASESTCKYCEISDKFQNYDIRDTNHEDDLFIDTAIKTADYIRKCLKRGKLTLVHCHSGRNRSALAVLVYCAKYTDLNYENSLYQIRLLNSSRFSMQSTLQNTTFTSAVRRNWDKIKKSKKTSRFF